jgi:hypothetical protein
MTEQWERQQREIDSYNVFFSAFKRSDNGDSLFDLDYRLAGMFVEIPDPRNDVVAEPDFVLFNGSTLLLTEVKSGRNINPRDVRQMEGYSDLSIEAAIEWLRDADLQETGYDPNGLTNIEQTIVYYHDFIEECRDSSGCAEALSELANHCAVLSQEKGGHLQLEAGDIGNPALSDLLNTGISIPTLVDKHIYVTENVDREVLAYSIVHDTVLNSIGKDEEIAIDGDDIVDRYRHRQIPRGKLNDALAFLRQIDACVLKAEQYVFRASNISQIMGIGEWLEETTVTDFLSEEEAEEGQSTLTRSWEGSRADDDDDDD